MQRHVFSEAFFIKFLVQCMTGIALFQKHLFTNQIFILQLIIFLILGTKVIKIQGNHETYLSHLF